MCIVFYTQSQPGYKLILAANRDEFLGRPATVAAWHNFDNTTRSDNWVLCGRDLGSPEAGTWLGMTSDLRVGILTNIRYPLRDEPQDAPSRGHLLKAFLAPPPEDAPSVDDFLGTVEAERYTGFNLLLWDLGRRNGTWQHPVTGYISNRSTPPILHPAKPGCWGMSNSPLEEPYPKVQEGEKSMQATLDEWTRNGEDDEQLLERMMTLLSPAPPVRSADDMTRAIQIAPLALGDGGIGAADPELSGNVRWYATRIATVILVRNDGKVIFVERDINKLEDGKAVPAHGERKQVFTV